VKYTKDHMYADIFAIQQAARDAAWRKLGDIIACNSRYDRP